MAHRLRVLIVDDHPGIVKALSRLLAADHDVVGSLTDSGGLAAAAHRLQADVIVLDMNLPSSDGLKACQQVTQSNPGVKVVVFTAGHDPDLRRRALEAGAAAFVDKLSHDGELLSALAALAPGG